MSEAVFQSKVSSSVNTFKRLVEPGASVSRAAHYSLPIVSKRTISAIDPYIILIIDNSFNIQVTLIAKDHEPIVNKLTVPF